MKGVLFLSVCVVVRFFGGEVGVFGCFFVFLLVLVLIGCFSLKFVLISWVGCLLLG